MKHILIYGDSNSWGYDVTRYLPEINAYQRMTEDERWPGLVRTMLGPGYRVIEDALNGRTTLQEDPYLPNRNGLMGLRIALDANAPLDLVVIMLGTNDCKRKFAYSMQDISWGMERFLQKVLTHRQYASMTEYRVLLVAPPPMNEGLMHSWLGDLFEYEAGLRKSRALAKWFAELARRYNIDFLDAGQHCESSPLDGVHLDAENQRKLGLAVADYVRSIK